MLRNTHPYTPIHRVRLTRKLYIYSYIEFAGFISYFSGFHLIFESGHFCQL